MAEFVKRLEAALQEKFSRFSTEVAERQWIWWRSGKRRTAEDASNIVDKFWPEAARSNTRLFVGDPDLFEGPFTDKEVMAGEYAPIVAIPEIQAVDVVEFARVGTGGMSEPKDKWKEVRECLSLIYRICDFDITFADTCGLHAYFSGKVSKKDAEKIEKMIYGVDPYYCFVLDQRPMSDLIVKEKKFILYWEK